MTFRVQSYVPIPKFRVGDKVIVLNRGMCLGTVVMVSAAYPKDPWPYLVENDTGGSHEWWNDDQLELA